MGTPIYMTLECGPVVDNPSHYWIKDVTDGRVVAIGVPEEYALLMVAATNEQFGDPKFHEEQM